MGFENPTSAAAEQNPEPEPPRTIERSMEQTETLFKKEQFVLHGKSIEILGVTHTPETYERYWHALEQSIQHSAVVMLEVAPNATGVYTPETARWYARIQNDLGIKMTPVEAEKELQSDPTFAFFSAMESLAAKHGKDIVVADPMSTAEQGIINVYSRTMLDKKDEEMDKVRAFVLGVGILGVMAPHIIDALRHSAKIPHDSGSRNAETIHAAKQKDEPTRMSRRNFLKFLGGAAAATVIGSESAVALRRKGFGGRGENPLGVALYDSTDYRDVIAAEGLERVTLSPSHDASVAIICGEKHQKPLRHYAESPRERTLKAKAYAPYRGVAKPYLRRFRYHKEYGWQSVSEEQL